MFSIECDINIVIKTVLLYCPIRFDNDINVTFKIFVSIVDIL